MFKVYKLAKENRETIDKLLADDVLGRQTITYKDGTNYEWWILKDIALYILDWTHNPDKFQGSKIVRQSKLRTNFDAYVETYKNGDFDSK